MIPLRQKQLSVLVMSTLAFTVCFAVWMMFAVIGIPIKEQLGLNETQFGTLIATTQSLAFQILRSDEWIAHVS